ncbi:hypothetical protein Tco_0704426 [Tanacetum coccineum]|uniref:Uncharacterized protein n=1 Tax=Tanacetum coccineum TaxID=301880 RepID=A0ABQ4Y2K8_9ASTR
MIKIHPNKNVADFLTKAFDKGIGVNAGDSKLMLLDINLLLLEKVNVARHNLLLLVQLWATAKVKTVNGEVQLQALVDGQKVIIIETSVRRDLQLEDAEGIKCLPNADIFKQLALMGAKSTAWNEFSSTMASAIICLATNHKFNFSKYIFESMVKNVDSSVKFLMYPRFVQVFLDKQVGDMSTHDEIFVTPSHTKKKKQKPRKPKRKDTEIPQSSGPTEPISDEAANEENVPTHSNDLLLSGEDRLKLKELMTLCTNLQNRGNLNTFLMGDKEIELNSHEDIDDLVPIPRVSEKPLDSLDCISKTFDMIITDPLFDFDSEFTLNSDNLILDIQNKGGSEESEMETHNG